MDKFKNKVKHNNLNQIRNALNSKNIAPNIDTFWSLLENYAYSKLNNKECNLELVLSVCESKFASEDIKEIRYIIEKYL